MKLKEFGEVFSFFDKMTKQKGGTKGFKDVVMYNKDTCAHLHFGVRYNNSGYSTVPQLAKVVMDSRILKSYQTECAVNVNGTPTDWIRYYRSSNRLF